MIKVWDPLVRIIHWSVALTVLGNFLTESGALLHRRAGYIAAALVLVRLGWGFTSRGYARFSVWWPGIGGLFAYLRAAASGTAPRHIGINPAGAVMACAIWLLVLSLAVTGWMMGLDPFWGEEWLQDLHETIAYVLLACAGLHVSSVIAMSLRNRENLPKAMLTGKKRGN